MKKNLTFLFTLISFISIVNAQAPYISTGAGNGLGQYGYINKDATSFFRLDRNTYNNVNSLAARCYLNGSDVLYNVSNGGEWAGCTNWQCSGCNSQNLTTANINAADFGGNWAAGNDAYISVYAYYCGGGSSNSPGTTGFNERKFTITDLNTNTPSSLGVTVIGGGCNSKVVGTFTLDIGAASGRTLERFYTQNLGAVSETTLGNIAFKLYYEPSTGSEVFNGTESSGQLYGDYNGGSTTDNIFGNDALGIPLSGKTRFYLVACNNPVIVGSVNMTIINDGISLNNNSNGFSLLRINATPLGGLVILPITLTDFSATLIYGSVRINWTASSETNTDHYELEKSIDNINFVSISKTAINNIAGNVYSITDNSVIKTNFYRLKIVDRSGAINYSKTVAISIAGKTDITISPNPAHASFIAKGTKKGDVIYIMSLNGGIMSTQILTQDNERINIENFASGSYFIKIISDRTVSTSPLSIIK